MCAMSLFYIDSERPYDPFEENAQRTDSQSEAPSDAEPETGNPAR